MDVKTNLRVSQLNVQRIDVLSANIHTLSVDGQRAASEGFVLDAISLASQYGYKKLSAQDLSAQECAINRLDGLTSGQELTVFSPVPISCAVTEWQMMVDLTNLSSSDDPVGIHVSPPTGYTYNWLFVDGNTEMQNQKKYISIYQVVPSAPQTNAYDVVSTTRELKDGEQD